jgi:hypothetical protein
MDDAGHASTDSGSLTTSGCDKETVMSKLNLFAYPVIAVASLLAAGAAFAESPTPDDTAAALSLKSRAQVQAELFQARADGSAKVWSTTYNPLLAARSVASRDEVKAQRSYAHDVAFYGEDSGSFALSRTQPARQPVRVLASAAK